MQNKRDIIDKAKDVLLLCLRDAINTSLTATRGEDWFQVFAQEELPKKKSHRLVSDPNHKKLDDLDLQAYLKLLRYREQYSSEILSYFRIDTSDKSHSYIFDKTLDNLIHIVRNSMYAHASATIIEGKENDSEFNSVYGYDEAMNDIILLAKFFAGLKSSDGELYVDKLEALKKSLYKSTYDVEETIFKEKLNLDTAGFITYCTELGVDIITKNNKICFVTSEYVSVIAQIKNKITTKKSKHIPVVVAAIIIAVLVISGIALAIALSNGDHPTNTRTIYTVPVTTTKTETNISTTKNEVVPTTTTVPPTTVPPTTAISGTHIYGQLDYNGSTLTIDQEQDKTIILSCSSNANNLYFGWTWDSAAYFILKTNTDFYSYDYPTYPYRISPYQEEQLILYFNELSEDEIIEYIEIHHFGDDGLTAAHDFHPVTINISYK